MKAFQLISPNATPTFAQVQSKETQLGQAKVRVHAAGWNRRDHWIVKGLYPKITLPVTLGSDACGVVEDCPSQPELVGQEVIICPSLNWGEDPLHQGDDFHILGMPNDGCLAEEVIVPVQNIFSKPPHLRIEEAAALPLAGLTAWRALSTKARVVSQEKVLITGIGGGTAIFALQFALAKGAEVFVTSSSPQKLKRAIALGASNGALYTNDNWEDALSTLVPSGFDVIIDSAGGEGFGALVKLLGMGGRLVFFGGTRGRWPPISPQYLFFKQVSFLASTMGSLVEFKEMRDFVNHHRITPIIDRIFPFSEITESLNYLLHPERFGKIIVQID